MDLSQGVRGAVDRAALPSSTSPFTRNGPLSALVVLGMLLFVSGASPIALRHRHRVPAAQF